LGILKIKPVKASLGIDGMKFNVLMLGVISTVLFACATPPPSMPPAIDADQVSLAEASYSVSRSITDLAETAQATRPFKNIASPPSPASYGMGGLTSVDWSGPIEPILQQIAKAADYRVRVVGTAPAIPILVTVYQQNAMLGDILRDIGYQSGDRGVVAVFPESKVIELRYAKN
jgi:defect-in-organelle-trafficking protein DotD